MSHINYNDAKEVSYQYNKVGELVKMDDWLGTTTFEVDLLGQLTKMTDHKGNVVEYTYDAVGNQTSVTYPDETTVTKTYDNTYNLTKVTDAENQNYLYQYDDAGRVTKLTYPNGWVEDYTYDNEGNLLKTVDTDPFHNNKKSTKYEYRYDAEGNLISEYKRDTTAGNKALTTTYAYDALNRLVSAHEEGVGVNTTRTYQYDTLGSMIREEQDGCIEYRYNGYSLDESTKCGTIPNSIGTAYWEYTYDGRGNLISNDKYTRTTSGMDWQNVETYVYDETNRMVQGTNELGEVSIYTYNGLGIRVGRELIMKDNTHGYTDFHSQTPSVETGIDKPEVVKESYVIDYTSATFNTLAMDEVGGFNYRWTYGLGKLNVKITSEGTNWWGQHVTTDILKDYLHQDRMGSTTNLTDTFGRVVGRTDYNEWGEMTYREALTITSSYRRIYPQSNYTGHDWDDVLGMYYAKARFYSADDKRFVAMDPIKGNITDPLSLVSYLYCVDNPLRWVDPLGLYYIYEDGNDGYIAVPQDSVLTIMGEVSNLIPEAGGLLSFLAGLIPGLGAVGGSSANGGKIIADSLQEKILSDGKENAIEVLIPGLKGSGGDLAYLFDSLNFWNNLDEAMEIPRMDFAAFNLLQLIGIESPRGKTIEEVEWKLSIANLYIQLNSWFFYDWSYEKYVPNVWGGVYVQRGASAFENLINLQIMKNSGEGEEYIKKCISEYWSDFYCPGAKTRNTELQDRSIVIPREIIISPGFPAKREIRLIVEESVNLYNYALTHYDTILNFISEDFKNFYEGIMSIYYN